MKIRTLIISIFGFLILTSCGYSQPQGERMPGMMGPNRIEKYKKMRLLELLNLPEEAAVRFNAKYNLHEDKLREMRKLQEELEDRLEEIVNKNSEINKNLKEIQKTLDELDNSRSMMVSEDERFMKEMRNFLDAEQVSKFYIFQRKFERDLRDAIKEMRREGPRSRMRDE
jgi:septal ring factor EnvC (AmiA/AmiB activator)